MIKTLADGYEEIPKNIGQHTKQYLDSINKINVGGNTHDFQYLCGGCEKLQEVVKEQLE